MTIHVRAPATSANLGAGFDCAGVAFDLWNELVIEEAEGERPDPRHIGIRAFGLCASPDGLRFTWTERIPRARGLGSSAATIALGLVAGMRRGGEELSAETLLARGAPLEGHVDNLAAALAGGVTLALGGRIARVADRLPLDAVALIPKERTRTAAARAALPDSVPHADAAFTVARAALLGASAASGDADLFAAALDDRLHEPYRPSALLDAVRADLPAGARGATLSGSGPTVIVWTADAAATAAELAQRHPGVEVMPLAFSAAGAL